MKYVIVDDEPLTHDLIENMASDLPFLTSIARCDNALDALPYLNSGEVDLLFLDIHLPRLSGFDFLRTLAQRPLVIAISADRDYALEGYDLDICDYLLKPFLFERFLKAVNKARSRWEAANAPVKGDPGGSIFLKDGKHLRQVALEDILYVEACANYCRVVLVEGQVFTHEPLTELEARLPEPFFRVHKSYLVSKNKIRRIAGGALHLDEKAIPIGRVYKPRVMAMLRRAGLS